MEVIGMRRRIVGDDSERVEAHPAIGLVTATFDDLDRSIEERPDPFRLRDGMLLTGRQDGPGRSSPDSIHHRQRSHHLALGRDLRGRVITLLRGNSQRCSYCHDENRKLYEAMFIHLVLLSSTVGKL